ncbi:unnamed protein product [Fusarium graminearum]|nr:unnamed protein product [Fusarium graminearum]
MDSNNTLRTFVGRDMAHTLASHHECARPVSISNLSDSQKQRKRRCAKFSKRRATFLKKANDLSRECDEIDVYVEIRNRRNNQVWSYSNGYVPLTEEQRANTYPKPIGMGPDSFSLESQKEGSKE